MADAEFEPLTQTEASQPEFLDSELPASIGRYRVQKVIGEGSFGRVFLARDEQLDRPVAIKVPHAKLIKEAVDAEAYLSEARMVANLEHPSIVPVLDVGSSDEFPCYVVSRFVEGTDLADRLKQIRLGYSQAAALVATVAEALHYAHSRGIVHRDIKPGNILISPDEVPYVVDFGLALKEEEIGTGPRLAGSPAYMSPEQARGESHRVDGRSDIYGLGAVLFELLTGQRTFKAKSRAELRQLIATQDPRPPRQIDAQIPKELERICLKALARRRTERYTTAHDLADDLRHFLSEQPHAVHPERPPTTAPETKADSTTAVIGDSGTAESDRRPIRIVPKGLRSFDAHDADFFLELLPGPRDRDGLPDSLRFWKQRIEETDADTAFTVGLIYGPSGCGKSSMVKAGLLPHLASHVKAVYVEATAGETETRLCNALKRTCPALSERTSLPEMLFAARKGRTLVPGQKLLIILDQFEQWLHAQHDPDSSELVQALRQCDGHHVQCIVMVRDDFWLGVSRFMRELEVRVVEGENSALTDLFDEQHACRVLTRFGQAFGKLPDRIDELSSDHEKFLSDSVIGLSGDGKVICVRLALFAEMIKGKAWTPETLKAVGGTQGLGVTFLEETFSSSTAPPEHRYHQKAARAVLMSLLPDSGTEIKGHWKSRAELLEASGYDNRPRDFEDLIRILDGELRLITPTDPDGQQLDDDPDSGVDSSGQYYQLTHDYLVPSLRDWLTRKQQETRRGRAALRLETRTSEWTREPINRRLPAWWEFLNIRCFTRKRDWTVGQRRMMRRARTVHGARTVLLALLLIVGGWAAWEFSGRSRAETLVSSLLNAQADRIPALLAQLPAVERWAVPLLEAEVAREAESAEERRRQLHARLALVADDSEHVEPLVESLLSGPWSYVTVIRDHSPATESLTEQLWTELRDTSADHDRRLKAAMALAPYVDSADDWSDSDRQFVVDHLLASNPEFQPTIRAALRPRRDDFLPLVEQRFQDPAAAEALQQSTTAAMVDWASDQPERLSEAITWARPAQWPDLLAVWQSVQTSSDLDYLLALTEQQPDASLSSNDRITMGKRRANAAIALALAGNLDGILSVMQVDDDPEALSQFAARCRGYGVELNVVLNCFDRVEQQRAGLTHSELRRANRALYGLLLSAGEYELESLPSDRRETLIAKLTDWYAEDPSSTVHGATGWLLRRWGQAEVVNQVDQTAVAYSHGREWYTVRVDVEKKTGFLGLGRTIQPLYFTFVVFEPGEYELGSPVDEAERDDDETQHRVRLTRPFAVLNREITRSEFEAFGAPFGGYEGRSPTIKHPMNGPSWFDSVRFSRWLTEQSGLNGSHQCYPSAAELNPPLERYPSRPGDLEPREVPLNLDGSGFRLPTESEWELACRGGMRTAYSFGGDPELLTRYGWFEQNSGKLTHVAGEQRPNLRGLFDMHGNLWEWCHDWRGGARGELLSVDPTGPASRTRRVVRGGCYFLSAGYCRSSFRFRYEPSYRRNGDLGFRLAVVPSSQ